MPKIIIDDATKYRIIKMLEDNPDGLTRTEISALLGGIDRDTLQYALNKMPCVYVDRWQFGKSSKPEAVWCVLEKPAKPPKPTTRSF
jgi:hypothetical protein